MSIDLRDLSVLQDIIDHEGWRVLQGLAEEELITLNNELRTNLDPRTAGKMEGIEWIFTTLENRIRDKIKEIENAEEESGN
jgi:hypothetical protein